MLKLRHLVVLAAACVVVSGCARSTIFKQAELKKLDVITTDASQRAILSADIGTSSRPGVVDPQKINCTEPSPDVANAIATSFSAGLGVFGQGSGSLSASQVETLAQLVKRTASIQLLRDKMYQTCLAYANGAISGTMYNLVMTKLDSTIVSLLLGESAAGRFGASLATLGGDTSGEATATLIGLPAGVEDLSGLSDELNKSQTEVDAKEIIYNDKKKLAEDKPDGSAEKQAEATAKSDLDAARTKRDELLKRLQSRAETLAKTGAKSAEVAAVGSIGNAGGPASAEVLLAMQREFLNQGVADFVVTGCFAEMGVRSDPGIVENVAVAYAGDYRADAVGSLLDQTQLSQFCQAFLSTKLDGLLLTQKEVALKRAEFEKDVSVARVRAAHASALAALLKSCEGLSDDLKAKCQQLAVGGD